MSSAASLATSAILLAPALAGAAAYEIDAAHSAATFSVKHLMFTNVRGELGKVSGKAVFDEKDLAKSSVEATIDVSYLDTREAKRDEHLKGPDFFDVAKYPTATFKSTKVEKAGAGKLKVTGNLTMHGVTKAVVLEVEGPSAEIKDPWGNIKVAASATGKLNRKDFGLSWNAPLESGGVLVGEMVDITLDVQLKKTDVATAAK